MNPSDRQGPPAPEDDEVDDTGNQATDSVVPSIADDAADGADEDSTKGLTPTRGMRRYGTVVFLLASIGFAAYLLRYYVTGAGGPTLLAVALVPVAYVIAILDDWRRGILYPRLGTVGSTIAAVISIGAAVVAAVYLNLEFDAIRMARVGRWNIQDLLAGATLIVLILEYSRRKYIPLFILSVVLVLYVVYGAFVPGLFGHAGMPWDRVVSSMSLEMTSGIFDSLPQLALTLIGSFILVLAVLRAFGAVDSILKWTSRLTRRSPHLLPQSAVIASAGIGMVSGSSAANAATTGTITIPAMMRAGMPKIRAAAIETASSLGGQMMPPLMGIAAFLMVNFLGVSYFEVMVRGFIPGFIYYIGVALAVYMVSARLKAESETLDMGRLDAFDKVNLASYVFAVGSLIYLLGVLRQPAMSSARQVFWVLLAVLSVMLVLKWWRTGGQRDVKQLIRPYGTLVETFARMTSELTLLLSILGIVTAAFTITGVPTKVGFLMLEVAGVNIAAMIALAFVFGYLLGMGLPVAPTYIVLVVVIQPFMQQVGIDPWSIHFYAFFIAVFGELSPPTSVAAAVTSRIADSSFVRTMFRALELCLPLLILMVGVFTWPGIVVEPGTAQIVPTAMVLIATLGVTVAFHSYLGENPLVQWGGKGVLLAISLALLLAPPMAVSYVLAGAVLILGGVGFMKTRKQIHVPVPAETT